MNKPLLLVVTGRPASGKSTLSYILSREINCPLLSRDALKEGYINTLNIPHSQLDNSAALHIYDTFFEVIEVLVSKGISIVVEAAFQNKLWKAKLVSLSDKAKIKIVICKLPLEVAKYRFASRLLSNPERERFHGDSALNLINDRGNLLTEAYEPVNINVPTLEVDTNEDYNPGMENIISFIRQ